MTVLESGPRDEREGARETETTQVARASALLVNGEIGDYRPGPLCA
jgi:hypothetical protein